MSERAFGSPAAWERMQRTLRAALNNRWTPWTFWDVDKLMPLLRGVRHRAVEVPSPVAPTLRRVGWLSDPNVRWHA